MIEAVKCCLILVLREEFRPTFHICHWSTLVSIGQNIIFIYLFHCCKQKILPTSPNDSRCASSQLIGECCLSQLLRHPCKFWLSTDFSLHWCTIYPDTTVWDLTLCRDLLYPWLRLTGQKPSQEQTAVFIHRLVYNKPHYQICSHQKLCCEAVNIVLWFR